MSRCIPFVDIKPTGPLLLVAVIQSHLRIKIIAYAFSGVGASVEVGARSCQGIAVIGTPGCPAFHPC